MHPFLLNRECTRQKPALAFTQLARYIPPDAQVPRHTANNNRDDYLNSRDALAPGGAAPGARGQRQARAPRRLRRARLSAGPHGPLWVASRLHRRERVWRRH